MPHIPLDPELPGLPALLASYPETAEPLRVLAETLLRGPGPLSRGERELIAAHVSALNGCEFCAATHSACAALHLPRPVVEAATTNASGNALAPRQRALLHLATAVTQGGTSVTGHVLGTARAEGVTDREIHDTVLIAAAFCMYNRYVDGLGAPPAPSPEMYEHAARSLDENGYAPG